MSDTEKKELQATAVYRFVNSMIGAFGSGFVPHPNPTLAEIHKVAQDHCKDYYGIEKPSLASQWGEGFAEECSARWIPFNDEPTSRAGGVDISRIIQWLNIEHNSAHTNQEKNAYWRTLVALERGDFNVSAD